MPAHTVFNQHVNSEKPKFELRKSDGNRLAWECVSGWQIYSTGIITPGTVFSIDRNYFWFGRVVRI